MSTDPRTRRLRPRVVLTWGICLTLGGVALELLLPTIGSALVSAAPSATPLDQGFLLALDLVVRVVKLGVTPIGAALVGAAAVMYYVAPLLARSAPTSTAEQSAPEP
jgi:hypothetical protein